MTGGAELRRRRDAKSWSREELARRVGASASAVEQWETDKHTPRKSRAVRIDQALEADGAMLRAFGYLSPSGDEGELAGLRRRVEELARDLVEMSATVHKHEVQLARRRRSGQAKP